MVMIRDVYSDHGFSHRTVHIRAVVVNYLDSPIVYLCNKHLLNTYFLCQLLQGVEDITVNEKA